jgi:hypothetical protein
MLSIIETLLFIIVRSNWETSLNRNVNKMIIKHLLGLSIEEGYRVEHKNDHLYIYAPKMQKIFSMRITKPGTMIEIESGYKEIRNGLKKRRSIK